MLTGQSHGSRNGQKLKLADSQIEAVRLAVASKVLVITGGPWVTLDRTSPYSLQP
jgi:hypothetical protein